MLKRVFLLATVFATGFSGLVYEVVWHRYLANLLGSQAEATAIILAVFLGGLAVGYAAFGRLSAARSPRRLVFLCGAAEAGIGLWAVAVPTIHGFLWARMGATGYGTLGATLADIGMALTITLVPTVLMGCTIPLLTRALSKEQSEAPLSHALIYSTNTAGAFLGCLVAGFVLIPAWGLRATSFGVASVNVLGAAALILLSRGFSGQPDPAPRAARLSIAPAPAALAFLAGFCGIAVQTISVRVAGFAMGSSEYAFSMIVAAYLLMLSLGAYEARTRGRETAGRALLINQLLAVGGLILLYILVPYLGYAAMLVRTTFSSTSVTFYLYHAACLGLFIAVLFPLVGPIGRTLPLLFAHAAPELPDSAGAVGGLYFANSFGCVCGALLGGYLFLFYGDLDTLVKALVALEAAGLVLVLVLRRDSREAQAFAGATVLLIVVPALVAVHKWNPRYLSVGLFRNRAPSPGMYDGRTAAYDRMLVHRTVVARRDDPMTSVAIIEGTNHSINGVPYGRSLIVNGKSDGASDALIDVTTMHLSGHIPALLSTSANDRALVIGFGLGMTAGALFSYENIRAVDTVEISPAVRGYSTFFAPFNHNVTESPKFHWHTADAYKFLIASADRYGLIVSEPSNPWVTGVERLYSEDFYRLALSRLADDGIFAQWVHGYDISLETARLVLTTFSGAFPRMRVFMLAGGDILLLGSKQPLGKANALAASERFRRPVVAADFKILELDSVEQLLALELPWPAKAFAGGPRHTLDFPKLSFWAGVDFFLARKAYPDQIQNAKWLQPWVVPTWPEMLVNQLLPSAGPSRLEMLANIARTECGAESDLKKRASWAELSDVCHSLVYALTAAKRIPILEPLTPASVALFAELTDERVPLSRARTAADAVKRAEVAVALAKDNDSLFTPVIPERLIALGTPCLQGGTHESLDCRTDLIARLARIGRPVDARALLAATGVSEASRKELETLIDQAEHLRR